MVRRASRYGVLCACFGVVLSCFILAGTVAAAALDLDAPGDAGPSTIVTVTVGAGDPAGVVTFLCDGSESGTATAVPGDVLRFGVNLTPGAHLVAARIDGGGTTAGAGPATIVSWHLPAPPQLLKPAGGYAARNCDPVVRAGSSTSVVYLFVNETLVGRVVCSPGTDVAFPRVLLGPGVSTFHAVAGNPFGQETKATWSVRRLDYPWPTCIVVDKSDYRLYWIRDGVLVKTYRIAHGKPRTPTPNAVWVVGAKEKRDPRGVYGPRRLRIYRRVGWDSVRRRYRYQIRQFGIHGTNEPWVIGTMASHGCIRLVNKDILELWPQVPVGTPVLTRQ